jgi:Nodulin-like
VPDVPPPRRRRWPAFFALFLASNGGCFVDMACVMTLLHNAGRERPLVTGISKALLGLGASVFTSLYIAFIAPNTRRYLLLCAFLPLGVIALATPSFEKLPRAPLHSAPGSPARVRILTRFLLWVGSLCLYILCLVLINIAAPRTPAAVKKALTAILLVVLILPPALLALTARSPDADAALPVPAEESLSAPLLDEPSLADQEEAHVVAAGGEESGCVVEVAHSQPPRLLSHTRAEPLTIRTALMTPEFYVLFLAMSCGMGGTLVLVNNFSQLAKSLRCSSGPNPYVSLFGVCSASGRLVTGYYGARLRIPRPAFLVVALGLIGLALASVAGASCGSLFAVVVVVGNSFGCLFALAPVVAGDLFGEALAGSLYGFVGASPAVGSFFLNTLVTGRVYDHHAVRVPDSPTPVCFGDACFRTTFLVSGAACAAGSLAAAWLVRRTRHMYLTL